MLTRVERNKKLRKSKKRFRLLIVSTIIIAFISIIHINNSYNALLDSTEANKIFSVQKEKNKTDITVLGKQIEISNEYILQGKDFLQKMNRQTFYWINNLLER